MTRWFLAKTPRGRAAACVAQNDVRRAVEVPPAPSLDFMELVLPVLASVRGRLFVGRFICFPPLKRACSAEAELLGLSATTTLFPVPRSSTIW